MSAPALTIDQVQNLADRYEARFGNLTDIAHPAILLEPRFLELLQQALQTGRPVTQEQVEGIFPAVSWDW